MTTPKQKISLTQEQETLLIPLYAKATESQRANPIFSDQTAQQILEQVDYDFASLNVPRKTSITLCLRANKLDTITRNFLAQHPSALVLHLGCGLDNRYQRLAPGPQVTWYDLDLPDVIELKRAFVSESEQYHLLASSVTQWDWLESIETGGRPVLVVAEGLLMYLAEAEVKTLLLKLSQQFPTCRLACDVYSPLTVSRVQAHPSLKKTGAQIQWGLADSLSLESWAPGIRLLEEWYFAQAPEIAKLGGLYGFLFKLAGSFNAANLAHRIVYYQL